MKPRSKRRLAVEAVPVSAAELRALKTELERRVRSASSPRPAIIPASRRRSRRPKPAPLRWNPDPDDVQRAVAQLVLTIVEFLRQLMERQAIRRMERKTLTKNEVEAVGRALMQLEQTVREIGKRFGLKPEELNLDLGPVKLI
jgi:Gas vesicle protein K